MRILVALGGNALLERGEKPDAAIQAEHVRQAARALAPLAVDHELIISHGNGPQVGVLALESAADPALSRPYPLDLLVAQTQGMIGYWLAQELHNAGVTRPVVALITQTVVDPADPAFSAPSKFIGPVYTEREAKRLAAEREWDMAQDGASWRRVVASPRPVAVPEIASIRSLSESGAAVICGGGGGVPVTRDADGAFRGLEAVVDKDLCAAYLATELDADRLLLLTDVSAVMKDFGTPQAEPIRLPTVAQLGELHLPAGSMGPKVDRAAGSRPRPATPRPSARCGKQQRCWLAPPEPPSCLDGDTTSRPTRMPCRPSPWRRRLAARRAWRPPQTLTAVEEACDRSGDGHRRGSYAVRQAEGVQFSQCTPVPELHARN